MYPNIGIVDAKLTWYVAVIAIVLGHIVSIWMSHRLALSLGATAARTAWATLPLALLMIVYTALSLLVIAEPMVH
jgi:glycerol-3-phosphate acyltransferase PlsY